MDIALGRMGGSKSVLIRSGISSTIELDATAERRRPDARRRARRPASAALTRGETRRIQGDPASGGGLS
jgi:ribonucleotide monophosphatase NagD (HAD superfamily)